jgi:single-stranded-DNA-specific exonuclease
VGGDKITKPNILKYLDLTALGTVCDVMSLEGINRAFVAQGLKILAQKTNIGLKELCEVGRLKETPSVYSLGFILGPRINAAGRLEDASFGLKLLTTKNEFEAKELALKLDLLNTERQEIEKETLKQAIEQAEKLDKNLPFILVAGEGWHQGVIGIVAGRLKDLFNKPVAVVAFDVESPHPNPLPKGEGITENPSSCLRGEDGWGETSPIGKASARSVTGVDIGSAVTQAKSEGLLINGGGHKAAAGFTITKKNLEKFNNFVCDKIEKDYQNYILKSELEADLELNIAAINLELVEEIEKLSPFGMGNSEPKIILKDAKIGKINIYSDKHIIFYVSDDRAIKSSSGSLKCVAFNALNTTLGNAIQENYMKNISILGKLKKNVFNGKSSPEFMVEDVECYLK